MSEKSRDYAYEALAEVTDADMDASRGELNVSLRSIRAQSGIEDSYLLAAEIYEQAKRYRAVMGDVLLTPTALNKHWKRVAAEAIRPTRGGTNLVVKSADACELCHGDRMVVVAIRTPSASAWMVTRGLEADETEKIDEYAPCPACNAIEVKTHRADGTTFRSLDPGATRAMLGR